MPEKILFVIFFLKVAFSSALGSFCTIPHYPSSYNTVDTILEPRKWPHNEQKWTKTPKTARKYFFPFFLFIVAFSSAVGSFCLIPQYPSPYNTVDTILDPRKWPHNEQKWTKTPKTDRKNIFPIFSFSGCIFLCSGVILHHPALS